jgi:hypothetical protein
MRREDAAMPDARGAVTLALLSATLSQAGCSAARGTAPHDMSATEHRSAAEAARDRATQETVQADSGGRNAFHHRAMASYHEGLAAAHAEAADRLAEAERSACEGIPARAVAPGLSGLDVIAVSRLDRPAKFREVAEGVGFVIGTAGSSFDSVERLVRCRVARAAATRDPTDPFSVAGAYVRVYRDDGEAAIVQVVSRDRDLAEEIIRRVRRSPLGAAMATSDDGSRDGGDSTLGRRPERPADDPRTHGTDPGRPGQPPGVDPTGGGRPGPILP